MYKPNICLLRSQTLAHCIQVRFKQVSLYTVWISHYMKSICDTKNEKYICDTKNEKYIVTYKMYFYMYITTIHMRILLQDLSL